MGASRRPSLRAAAMAGAWLLVVGACASNRTPERSFTTREEAAAAGMFDEHGVPERLVPPSADRLRERRDLKTHAIWARFEFDPADRPQPGDACRPLADAPLPGSATRGIGWWPELLRNDPATAREHFEIFGCAEPGEPAPVFLATHRSLPTAFFWRAPRR